MIGTADETDSLGRYGLQLVEEPPLQAPDPGKSADRSRGFPRLRLFEWLLLSGFAALEIGYLVALAQLARRALWPLISA